MSKQNEMVEQLKLLMSKYEHWAENTYSDIEIFQQRYIEISNTIAEQISPSSFFIRGDGTPLIRGYGEGILWEKNRETIFTREQSNPSPGRLSSHARVSKEVTR